MRIPLTSGAYSAPSIIANAQRCVNLYPEANPQETTPPTPVTHYPRPGLTPVGTPPIQGISRCCYGASNGDLYQVINQNVYFIDVNWNYTLLGALPNNVSTPVKMADNGTYAIVLDGGMTGAWITLSTVAVPAPSMAVIGDPNFLGGTTADFLDYFIVVNKPGTNQWYCTLANSNVFNALYIGVKTAWPDQIVSLCAVERAVWIFGPKKSEIWFNSGSLPFPFQIQPGLIIEHGCCAPYSVAKQDTAVYWLSQSPEGARMAMTGLQQLAQRISTHAIEAEWLTYPRVDDAIGSTYQINGHAFYCIDFPTADKTWVYDEATKQWHEEVSLDFNGNFHRSLVPFKTYAYGFNLGTNWTTGQLYIIDTAAFTDNGTPITHIRSFPHIMGNDGQRVTVWKFIADMQVGTLTAPTNPPPEVSLRTSRTRGASWGNKVVQPLGDTGEFYIRPTWNRLGFFADGVFELSWSAPMKTALNGAFIEIEPHDADV